jgi:hypothetical protein
MLTRFDVTEVALIATRRGVDERVEGDIDVWSVFTVGSWP